MNYQLAQVNIAKFILPQDNPVNADFVNNLDRINAMAESQPGFIWRLIGSGNSAMDVRAYEDQNIIVNLSVWKDVQSLVNFVYRNEAHKSIMRRRKEWFEKIDFHMVLWWIESDRKPSVEEAKIRLELLCQSGPSYAAFTFKKPFAPPSGGIIDPFTDECA